MCQVDCKYTSGKIVFSFSELEIINESFSKSWLLDNSEFWFYCQAGTYSVKLLYVQCKFFSFQPNQEKLEAEIERIKLEQQAVQARLKILASGNNTPTSQASPNCKEIFTSPR